MKKYIFFLVLSILAVVASAQTVVNGKWEFKKTENGWTLSKFNGSAEDTDVTLPDCVIVNGACVNYERVGPFAISGNPYIKKLTITPNIKYMESCAINGNSALSELIFSDKNTIGDTFDAGTLTFEYCSIMGYNCPIKTIYIGRNITDDNGVREHNGLFATETLTTIVFGKYVTEIAEKSFVGNFPNLSTINIPSNISKVDNNAFSYCGLKNIVIEDSDNPLSVGVSPFYTGDCTDIYLGRNINHLYEIDMNSSDGLQPLFYGVSKLVNLNIGPKLSDIWDYAFWSTSLSSLVIPDNVTSIGNHAFYTNEMSSLTLGKGLQKIGDYAFYSSSLKTVKVQANNPASCGENTFYNPSYMTLDIPVVSYSNYKNAHRWQQFKNFCYDGHPFVMDLNVDVSTLNLQAGQSCQITASISPSNAYNKTLEWTSSNSYVASVNENGYVTAKHVGEATITCITTDGSNLSQSVLVDVRSPLVNEIKLNYESLVLFEDNDFQIIATVLPSDAASKALIWTSSNPSVATIDQNGYGHTNNEGLCTITATALDGSMVSATCEIIVKPVLVSNISLNHTSVNLIIGDSQVLTATVTPDNAKNKSISWTSSDSNIASVSSDGVVTALKEGTVTITAKALDGSNVEASCVVNVKPILVSSISLNTSELKIGLDETYQLVCAILPENATNKSVSWSSSAPDVATVYDGLVQPIKVGRSVIVASTNDGTNLSAYCIAEITEDAGIYSVSVDTSLYITTSPNTISVIGAKPESEINIYNASGHLLYKGIESTIYGLNRGIYFVIVEGHSFKILL